MRTDRAADLAFICTCVLLLGVIGYRVAVSAKPAALEEGYRVGDSLSADIIPTDARFDRALVLIVHSKCTICTESMPFYKAVADERSAQHHPLSLFVLAREDPSVVRKYLEQYGLAVDGIFPISHDALKGTGFPTMLAVAQARTVTGVWRGRLSSSNQMKLIEHVFRN
jgi:hypothetical protein